MSLRRSLMSCAKLGCGMPLSGIMRSHLQGGVRLVSQPPRLRVGLGRGDISARFWCAVRLRDACGCGNLNRLAAGAEWLSRPDLGRDHSLYRPRRHQAAAHTDPVDSKGMALRTSEAELAGIHDIVRRERHRPRTAMWATV